MSYGQLSLTPVRVELPAYGYSFTVNLSSSESSNVLAIKEAISLTCPGNPRIDGQRIIWRGRVLNDEEKVADLWPEADGLRRIVHLSVHPSAWTGKPPSKELIRDEKGKGKEIDVGQTEKVIMDKLRVVAAPTSESTTSQPAPIPAPTPSSTPVSPALPGYLLSKHRQALSVLTHEAFTPSDINRELAVEFVNAHGYIWPQILDEQFPNQNENSEKGLRYQKDIIDGRPYLRLLNSAELPTPAQIHAFRILSYTIELLKLPPLIPTPTQPFSSATSQARTQRDPVTTPVQIPAHLNAILQQMGLPPINHDLPPGVVQVIQQPQVIQVNQQAGQFDLNQLLNRNAQHFNGNNAAHPVNPNPPIQIQHINLRPLILPIFMLSLRTLLLLYFVAPARKPFFLLLILAWVGWEIWGWFGGLGLRVEAEDQAGDIGRGVRGNNDNNGGGVVQAGVPIPPPVPQHAQAPAPNGPNAVVPANNNAPGTTPARPPSIIDALASFDITESEAALSSFLPENDVKEPGLSRKAISFFVLLIATVHPAVWNRRRAILRAREGRVKVEMNALTEGAGEQTDVVSGEADEGSSVGNGDGEESNDASTMENARRAQRRGEMFLRYMRRPSWVRKYMRRVIIAGGENAWADEAD
ncbi:hypothetical protein DFH05DRAFT_1545306 [Lentinula detonsa]|uniref:Ubiquitin-like domain-containing protein n=1 Tax=Lentinula detonsa TaxID=2804962 RepID=A0A9W8NUT1_9AGAR|nr:hypothetical protein DFH05DRAFT_1545306 [Lentinula detonsa]